MLTRFLARFTQIPGVRSVWRRYPVGSVDLRTRFGVWSRPHYAYGVFAAAEQAKRLKIPEISVIEFGVAGGRGLLALESIAAEIERHFGVRISVLGFDTGEGMPEAGDYRDLPHVWAKGFYKMDRDKLRAQLKHARLVLGDVKSTIPDFMNSGRIPPVGFISFDLDYYSSTRDAFRIFDFGEETRLPRVYCYFDDIIWPERACHNEYTGELCAIREFNEAHESRKISPIHMLRHMRVHEEEWNEQIYVMHDFEHPAYCVNITPATEEHTQLHLQT